MLGIWISLEYWIKRIPGAGEMAEERVKGICCFHREPEFHSHQLHGSSQPSRSRAGKIVQWLRAHTYCSCKGLGFSSQHAHGSSQPAVIPFLGALPPSSDPGLLAGRIDATVSCMGKISCSSLPCQEPVTQWLRAIALVWEPWAGGGAAVDFHGLVIFRCFVFFFLVPNCGWEIR